MSNGKNESADVSLFVRCDCRIRPIVSHFLGQAVPKRTFDEFNTQMTLSRGAR